MSDVPMHPLQAMVDGWSAAWQQERATTQMTLGGLIAALEALPPDARIVGLGEAMSYRGYYRDLAFAPDTEPRSVAETLARVRKCMGAVFEGYKGGDYVMGATTPLWSAEYGDCGPRIMSLNTRADPVTLVCAEEES